MSRNSLPLEGKGDRLRWMRCFEFWLQDKAYIGRNNFSLDKSRSVYDVFFMLAQKNQRGPNWSTQFDHGTEGSTPGPPCVFVPHKWTYWKGYCSIYGEQVIPCMDGRTIICALVRRPRRPTEINDERGVINHIFLPYFIFQYNYT